MSSILRMKFFIIILVAIIIIIIIWIVLNLDIYLSGKKKIGYLDIYYVVVKID